MTKKDREALKNPVIPEHLMIPNKVTSVRPITTAERIASAVYNLTPNVTTPRAQPDVVFASVAASAGGGIPPSPPLLAISDDFQPAVGVYLVPGGTASGKSVLTTAITGWANAQDIPATYHYVFEPRARPFKYNNGDRFRISSSFMTDIKAIVNKTASKKLIVVDSATLPMKVYSGENEFKNQSTFPGGSQPSDRGFLDMMSKVAEDYNVCFLLTMNNVLIPYAADLAGAVEGLITFVDVMHFSIQDRTTYSARVPKALSVPAIFVNAALKAWGFNEYNSSNQAGSWKGERAGIYSRK
jgi:hypothetical protein